MGSLRLVAALPWGAPRCAFRPWRGTRDNPGRTAIDISIGPTGEELPQGRGTARRRTDLSAEGLRRLPRQSGHRAGQARANRKAQRSPSGNGAHPAAERAVCDHGGLHHRAMPLGNEGTLTADEVYGLTAYLLFLNKGDPGGRSPDKQSAEGQDADWR